METKITAPIIRGTTPTIKYAFKSIDVASIAAAYLVLEQEYEAKVVKDLTQATASAGVLEWKLAQADTLALTNGKLVRIRLDWRLSDGTRGIGKTVETSVTSSAVNGVI